MDILTLFLVVLILVFLLGGMRWPAPQEGGFPFGGLLYLLAFVIVLVVILRLLGVLL